MGEYFQIERKMDFHHQHFSNNFPPLAWIFCHAIEAKCLFFGNFTKIYTPDPHLHCILRSHSFDWGLSHLSFIMALFIASWFDHHSHWHQFKPSQLQDGIIVKFLWIENILMHPTIVISNQEELESASTDKR